MINKLHSELRNLLFVFANNNPVNNRRKLFCIVLTKIFKKKFSIANAFMLMLNDMQILLC